MLGRALRRFVAHRTIDHRNMPDIDVQISEVGPRDGLQNIDTVMSTPHKQRWIAAEAAAGVRDIEVGSFVPATLLPQLADTAQLVAWATRIEGLTVGALVPNERGARDAIAAGAHKITVPFSVSETHSLRNVRRSHEQMFDEVRRIVACCRAAPQERRPQLEVSLSTAFGCPIEGPVAISRIVAIAERVSALGCDEVGLADTSGSADPVRLRETVRSVWDAVGQERLRGVHLHNTRGQGLACALAAVEMGIDTIDCSLGGLGGCPFAPGASGNIVTEDLVFMLESMGLSTGVDLPRLIELRAEVEAMLADEAMYGFTASAGLPLGFQPAARAASPP